MFHGISCVVFANWSAVSHPSQRPRHVSVTKCPLDLSPRSHFPPGLLVGEITQVMRMRVFFLYHKLRMVFLVLGYDVRHLGFTYTVAMQGTP